MAVDKSYARLGFFLMLSLVVIMTTGLFFLQRMRHREVVDLVTYTTGNVAGLNIGSPVRFRGVPLGRVEELRIDPRGSLIQVNFEIFVERLAEVGGDVDRIKQQAATGIFEAFRAQVVANPVTGEAYLSLDRPASPPEPMKLPFTPQRAYVPFMPTALQTAQDLLPALMDRAVAALGTMETIIARIPASLDRSDQFFASIESLIRDSQLPAMTADSRKFFSSSTEQLAQMTSEIERITKTLDRALGPDGTLAKFVEDTNTAIAAANLEGTTKSTRDAMNQSGLAADELRRALPAIRDALAELRDLARLLESQPESVVYGRSPKGKR